VETTPRKYRILHADDEEGWRDLIGLWLNNAGYEVRTLGGGRNVLAAAKEFKPDCVILDHDLGDATGREVCEALKAAAEFVATPVILMTAHADVLTKVLAGRPPEQFIVKSDQPEELLLILEGLLGGG
jgi:DNA-binding response OmpR family regulator